MKKIFFTKLKLLSKKINKKVNKKAFFFYWILLLISHDSFAGKISIVGQVVIDKPTVYRDEVIDLSKGSFVVTNNASLDIIDSKVEGTISPTNPFLIQLQTGNLRLKNSIWKVQASNIPVTPGNSSIYFAIKVQQGSVLIDDNSFTIAQPYTAGLLTTGYSATTNFKIINNKIKNFNGGFYLENLSNSIVSHNYFTQVGISNIYISDSSNAMIDGNRIVFSGNNNAGDALDIIDSAGVTIKDNRIDSGSCYAIFILRAQNVLLDNNSISSDITYAIYINRTFSIDDAHKKHLQNIFNNLAFRKNAATNQNITITNNYFAQNRYGIAGTDIDGLTVKNNIFIQRFSNNSNRIFWTDNDHLLTSVLNMVWENNLYKEAFTQENVTNGNTDSLQFVPFPAQGGVSL